MAEPNALAVVAGRQFWVWSKAFSTANAFPADTVNYGDAFAGYTKLGYTSGGLQMNWNLQRGTVTVDQELDPILRPAQSRSLQLVSSLAEFLPSTVQLSTGQGDITSVTPLSGIRGHDQVDITSNIIDAYNTVIFDIRQQNGEALRIAAWRGLPTGSPQPRFEPNSAAVLAYQLDALPDTSTTPARIAAVRLVTPAAP